MEISPTAVGILSTDRWKIAESRSSAEFRRMMQFADAFPDDKIVSPAATQLSWSHIIEILPLKDILQREFYLTMAAMQRWSTKHLRKEIDSMLFERTAIATKPDELIKQELANIRDNFYHRKLHRLVAIDLKLGRFKAQYKGQMELYLRWLEANEMEPGEESPLGLLLCTEGSEEQIELLQLDKAGIKVAKYMTELPPRDVLIRQMQKSLAEAKERLGNEGKEDEV